MFGLSNFSLRVLGAGVLLLIVLAVFGCGKSERGATIVIVNFLFFFLGLFYKKIATPT